MGESWVDRDCCRDAVPAGYAAALGMGISDDELRLVRHRYVCEGWSVRRIADQSGMNRQRLAEVLRAMEIEVVARGVGRPRPWTRSPEPDWLRETLIVLYSELRLSSVRIGDLLGMPDRRVRLRLREFGIRRRTRGRCNREDRREVDPLVLAELMMRHDMPGTEVSRRTGEPYPAVLRSAHALGLPVQLGGPPPRTGRRRIRTLDALYADALVMTALRRFDVPVVPPGRPLWERFPEPVALTRPLLTVLYLECGLSSPHIELLTGQPAATVRRRLREFDIPLRPAGGRAPVWSRWRLSNS
ncbi:MAG TPA: hypothetical protein VF444_03925 [Pseudonocardiaceae bacterium]